MEPSSSTETGPVQLSRHEQGMLLGLADAAVRQGLFGHHPAPADPASSPSGLRQRCGAFVTLTVAGELNGCIGTLQPQEPLAGAVPRLAWEAAFSDPRLPPLTAGDYDRLDIKISVLSPLAALDVASETELLATLRPGIDGLVIAAGRLQATFLPAVWKTLPDPTDFVSHLKHKAGIPPTRWPPSTRAFRYTAIEFGTA